jgi:nitrogenase iron protein NifH
VFLISCDDEEEKVRRFAVENGLEIVADIPRSNDINRFEDEGKTVIEGDITLPVSQKFVELAKLLLKDQPHEE